MRYEDIHEMLGYLKSKIVDAAVADAILRSSMSHLHRLHAHSELADARKILLDAINKIIFESEESVYQYRLLTQPQQIIDWGVWREWWDATRARFNSQPLTLSPSKQAAVERGIAGAERVEIMQETN